LLLTSLTILDTIGITLVRFESNSLRKTALE
jgi:hypothetical protein